MRVPEGGAYLRRFCAGRTGRMESKTVGIEDSRLQLGRYSCGVAVINLIVILFEDEEEEREGRSG